MMIMTEVMLIVIVIKSDGDRDGNDNGSVDGDCESDGKTVKKNKLSQLLYN